MRYRKRPRGIGTFWWSVGLSRLSNESSNGSKLKSGLWDLSTYNVHTCTHVRPKLTLFFAITGFWMYTEWPKGKCTDVNRKSRILYILVVSSENQLFSLFLYDERVEGRFSNKMHRITPKLPCLVCSQSTSGAIHIVSEGRNFGLDFDINMQWPQKDIDGWPHVRVNNVYCISCCFFLVLLYNFIRMIPKFWCGKCRNHFYIYCIHTLKDQNVIRFALQAEISEHKINLVKIHLHYNVWNILEGKHFLLFCSTANGIIFY